MRRFLVKILCFGLCFSLAYILVLPIWVKLMPKPFKKNIQFVESDVLYYSAEELKETKNVDILFIGSSHVYRGVDPRLFESAGFKIFGLGTSGQTHEQTEVLLKRYLDQLNPRLIAYEVYPLLFGYDGTGSSISLLGSLDMQEDFYPLVEEHFSLKMLNSLIYAKISELIPFFRNTKLIANKSESYIGSGFIEEKNKPGYTSQPIQAFNWSFYDYQVDAFKRNLELIQDQGIPVLLYKAPVTKHYESSVLNEVTFDSLMQTTNVPYFNFSPSDLLVDTLHFYDKDHMNFEGVQIFNKELMDSLSHYLN